ncbi:MAG: hypothetical protein IJ859_08705 [Synergistaceae bacterium]|nr:hypothetical protein [Synergistaceae bacterium]
MEFVGEKIYTQIVAVSGGYDVKQYKRSNGEKIAAVIERQTQINIYPNVKSNDVPDLIAMLRARRKTVTCPVAAAIAFHNGNIKIVLPGIKVAPRATVPQNCSTDDDIDIVMEIINRVLNRKMHSI